MRRHSLEGHTSQGIDRCEAEQTPEHVTLYNPAETSPNGSELQPNEGTVISNSSHLTTYVSGSGGARQNSGSDNLEWT